MPAAVIETGYATRRAIARRLRGVYAITPELADTHDLISRVDAALTGGVCAIQYRNKQASMDERHAQAVALAPVVRAHGALYIINDDPEIAAAVDADGVHIGEDDAGIEIARRCIGPERIVGVSCYNSFQRAEIAVDEHADYIAFGSFFESSIKPQARRADIGLLSRARSLDVPVVAIGGITAANAGELAHAGADAVAVISAVFGASDPLRVKEAARILAGAMTNNRR